MKITAYKCPDTGQIFEYKKEYDGYRRTYLANRRQGENKQTIIDGYNKILEDFRSTPRSWAEMGKWICDNTDVFVKRAWLLDGNKTKPKSMKLTSVAIVAAYRERCSNTHAAPFNGVKNWYGLQNLPGGYPGWYGTIKLSYTGDYDGFFTNMFENTGLNFGTGSGGVDFYQSEITLFEDDWPGLREQRVFKILGQ